MAGFLHSRSIVHPRSSLLVAVLVAGSIQAHGVAGACLLPPGYDASRRPGPEELATPVELGVFVNADAHRLPPQSEWHPAADFHLTRMDFFLFGSRTLVFVGFWEAVASATLARSKRHELALRW
jgi:hypothetical protein